MWHTVSKGVGHIDVAITFLGKESQGACIHALRQLPPGNEYWLQISSDIGSRRAVKLFEQVGFRDVEDASQYYYVATGREGRAVHRGMHAAALQL